MIIKCKVCGGSGSVQTSLFDSVPGGKLCPACRGAGEFELSIPEKRLTHCKHCKGAGTVMTSLMGFNRALCPACKGIGVMERPVVSPSGNRRVAVEDGTLPRPVQRRYDIAVSFAGEDREVAEAFATSVRAHGLKVFFADFEQSDLWGTDLYETLDRVYRREASYCVMFVSRHYAKKVWTSHERKAAQARALQENREYILPVRLDDTEVPGLLPTIHFLDFSEVGLEGIVEATLKKVPTDK